MSLHGTGAPGTPLDEESLYDAYLDACLAGDVEDPDAFLARHPGTSEDLARRIRAVGALREPSPERITHGGALPFERLGDYRLLRRLGVGGMGTVFVAEQEALGRRAAIKVVRSDLRRSETMLRRFAREAQAVARLRHPNIVNVYEFGTDQGASYIAMEFVRGRPLDEILRDDAPPREQVLAWCIQIARALGYAHGQGVVHRDVKPQNVMITPEGRAVLLDFGVARLAESDLTRLTQEFAGSPMYAAPEQLRSDADEVDGRADVYALGVTLYEAVTGRTPFQGGRLEELLLRILREEPARPSTLAGDVAPDLETVILKAMEKRAEQRYATADDFADDLQRVLDIRPIRAKPPGLGDRLRKWTRRHPVASGVLGALLVAALIVGAVLARGAAEDRSRARELVAEARGQVEALRASRLDLFEREDELERQRLQRSAAYKTEEEDLAFELLLDEIEDHRRGREQIFTEVLELLARARDLHADVEGIPEVRALLFNERAEAAHTARESSVERYFRKRVQRDDPTGAITREHRASGDVGIQSTPAGADVYLFRFEEQRAFVPAGDRRLVPVPHGTVDLPEPLRTGRWALRVVDGGPTDLAPGDVIVEVEGHPVRDTVLLAADAGEGRRGDRVVAHGTTLVTSLWHVDPKRLAAGTGPLTIVREGERRTVPLDPAMRFVDAAGFAEAGAGWVSVWRAGAGALATRELPAGARLRPTAAPRLLVPSCRIGTTPVRLPRLTAGSYVAVLRKEGHEELVLPLEVEPRIIRTWAVDLHPEGTCPAGFVRVPGARMLRTGEREYERWADTWISERPVDRGEYLAFLRAVPDTERIARQRRAGHYAQGEDGTLALASPAEARLPVTAISWMDAAAYAAWRSAQDGRRYRLPRLVDWQRALGGTARRWPFGNAFRHKWANSNISRPGPPGSTEIEPPFRYPIDESPLGVFDVTGNASTWLDQWWGQPEQRRKHWTGGAAPFGDPKVFASGQGNGARMDAGPLWVGMRLVLDAPE